MSGRGSRGWIVWGLVFLGGCAAGELTPQADDAPCKSQSDCQPDERCQLITGRCEPLPDLGPEPPDDMGADEQPDTPDGAPDDCAPPCELGEACVAGACEPVALRCDPPCDPATQDCQQGTCITRDSGACEPACGVGEVCQQGRCEALVCEPACDAPGMCTAQGCAYPSCQAHGARCDPSSSEQGAFRCLVDAQRNEARCVATCATPGEASGCPRTTTCQLAAAGAPGLCAPSQCDDSAPCAEGATCVRFDNEHARCVPSGQVAQGGPCDQDDSARRCQSGLLCAREPDGMSRCRPSCSPWASPSQCGAGQRCNRVLGQAGACVANPDAMGMAPYEVCARVGDYCADGVPCASGATDNFCYQQCRPDRTGSASDCRALASSVCNAYALPGDRAVGYCVASCTGIPGFCRADQRCVEGACRRACDSATVVQDCCAGQTPCAWQCVSGLCA